MTSLLTEQEVLGFVRSARVISAQSVINSWNKVIKKKRTDHEFRPIKSPGKISVFYHKETIQPLLRERMWRLVYDPGFSLKEIRLIFGSSIKDQPCHYNENNWWLFDKGCGWTDEKKPPNYHLVRMRNSFSNLTWSQQGLEKIRMGKKFIRASHRFMISFNISYYLIHGVYPSDGCSHWGPKMNSEDQNINASCIDSKGFAIYRWNRNCPSTDLGVCVVREHDSF